MNFVLVFLGVAFFLTIVLVILMLILAVRGTEKIQSYNPSKDAARIKQQIDSPPLKKSRKKEVD